VVYAPKDTGTGALAPTPRVALNQPRARNTRTHQSLRPGVKSAIAAASHADADVKLAPGDTISAGGLRLRCLPTPGHTNGCMCFLLPPSASGGRPGMVFTGCVRRALRRGWA
jgi:glyoxylase-like metal-dependent hydrolase (beta-lactamase superfamily II)